MAEFKFLENPISKKWVILAPRRAKRPDVAHGTEPVCPFCPGREKDEQELYRVPSSENSENSDNQTLRRSDNQTIRNSEYSESSENDSNWLVRVVPNKFPFAPIHEIVIHSPDHHRNFGELPEDQVALILQTYRQRFITHQDKGQVYIFHNRGEGGGESLPHPHTQITVVPNEVRMEIPRLSSAFPIQNIQKTQIIGESDSSDNQNVRQSDTPSIPSFLKVSTAHFEIFCPETSQWPDEVWVAPKNGGRSYGEITDEEVSDLSHILSRLIQIFDLRHGNEFPFNFYIYPGGDWYLRLIPRVKTLGGFEVGTGVFVNTQDPNETIQFIQRHFEKPHEETIKTLHQAEYERRV